jgi:hypothetical protein
LAAHRHDDFATTGDMPDVAAEVVVKLAHAHRLLRAEALGKRHQVSGSPYRHSPAPMR